MNVTLVKHLHGLFQLPDPGRKRLWLIRKGSDETLLIFIAIEPKNECLWGYFRDPVRVVNENPRHQVHRDPLVEHVND